MVGCHGTNLKGQIARVIVEIQSICSCGKCASTMSFQFACLATCQLEYCHFVDLQAPIKVEQMPELMGGIHIFAVVATVPVL